MEDKVTLFGNIAHNIAGVIDEQEARKLYLDECVGIIEHDYRWVETDIKLNREKELVSALGCLAEMSMMGYMIATKSNSVNALANQMTDLYARKNRDYGNSFDKSMDKFGLVVAAIRIGDKVNRLQSLVAKRGEAEVKDESLADTFMDLACYSIMTMLWLHDKKEK